jgi:hypothetical protein
MLWTALTRRHLKKAMKRYTNQERFFLEIAAVNSVSKSPLAQAFLAVSGENDLRLQSCALSISK